MPAPRQHDFFHSTAVMFCIFHITVVMFCKTQNTSVQHNMSGVTGLVIITASFKKGETAPPRSHVLPAILFYSL